jgi:hypothetical protein
MSLSINELREQYQSSFIDNYDKWSKVRKNFNSVCCQIYVKEWQKTVLREDIQFLPFDIPHISYNDYCELFLRAFNTFDEEPNSSDIFYRMLEIRLKEFYELYTVKD